MHEKTIGQLQADRKLRECRSSNRELKRYLTELVTCAETFSKNMDTIMKSPSTLERGRAIARQCNALDYTKDRAKHFGLGIPFKNQKLNPAKK